MRYVMPVEKPPPGFEFARYLEQRAETRAALANYNHASAALELAQIKERLAEIESQTEPLASMLARDVGQRTCAVDIARYVVIGRKPKETKA